MPTLAAMLDSWIEKQPSAPAIITSTSTVTYGDLGRRIDRIATILSAGGLALEEVCAVAVERDEHLVAIAFAIFKAGGVYLPLGPEDPPDRCRSMLQEAQAKWIVYEQKYSDVVIRTGAQQIDKTHLVAPAKDPPAHALMRTAVEPRNLAYIMFTSGSTGVPKGVLTEHRAIANYLRFMGQEFGIQPGKRVLQWAAQNYEASIRDMVGPLVCGATVVLLPRRQILDPEGFVAAIKSHKIDAVLSIVPSFLSGIARVPNAAERLKNLRLVLSSGESILPCLRSDIRGVLRHARLVNQYGPTECALTATYFDTPMRPRDLSDDVIGRPIPNVTVKVLNDALEQVPAGQIGEIFIGGTGVSRGYVSRPGATASRYIPDPDRPGARMYRTGDHARQLPNGDFVFHGRVDRQVKVRGHRVELDEIEAALRSDERVEDAAVKLCSIAPGTLLVAYVVPRYPTMTSREVRRRLARVLPVVMIPRRFVFVSRIPRGSSGKVKYEDLGSVDTGA